MADRLQDDADGQRVQCVALIGPGHTPSIRAELGDVSRFSHVDQVVAYAGLEPRTRQSGAFVGQKHLSKRGPGALRHALSMGALTAVRFRPEWREPYQWLLNRGRAKKEALTILARALLKVTDHLLCTSISSDPALLNSARPSGPS